MMHAKVQHKHNIKHYPVIYAGAPASINYTQQVVMSAHYDTEQTVLA